MTLLFTDFLRVQPRKVLSFTEPGTPHISGDVQPLGVVFETYLMHSLLAQVRNSERAGGERLCEAQKVTEEGRNLKYFFLLNGCLPYPNKH